jgi:prepilin-type N-terminal cleavage/methylation domain-containing protein
VHTTCLRSPGLISRWSRLLSPAARRDEGFSLIEVAVAIGVFAIVGVFMSQLLGAGFKGVLLGKRREVATQEANRLIEVTRSLSYDAIGLVSTDATLATDEAIEEHEGKQSYLSDTTWEPLIWANNPSGHPFDPHIQAVERASTDLTDYIYITGVDANSDGTIDMKRITVRVSWDNAGTVGPKNEVRAQTLVNQSEPSGCVGDCSPLRTPLRAKGFTSGGSAKIESSILGLSNPLTVTLPSSTGTSKFRAVSDATCAATSATLQALDIVDLKGYSVSATADDDARTATPSDPAPQTSSGVLTIPAGPVTSILGPTIDSPISCDAAALPLPTEEGTGSALSAFTATTDVEALGGLLDWQLTIADIATLPVTQSIDQEVVAGQREIASAASGSVGTVQILKIPSMFSNGLVQVDGLSYGVSVRGAAGTPSEAPTVTTPNFTVRVFDNGSNLGSGCDAVTATGISASRSGSYCLVTVNASASGYVGGSVSVTHNFTQLIGLNVVNLAYTVDVDFLPPAKSPADGVEGANGEKRWSAEYKPIVISASLDSSVLGTTLIDTDVNLNIGNVTAEACAGATCV